MTKRDILSISFKILGVVCIMYTIVLIPSIGMAIGMLLGQQESEYARYAVKWHFFITVLFPIFTSLFGLLLLKWGDAIASRLIREDTRIEITPTDDWERRVFCLSMKIIGLIWLIRAIPDLIKAIGELTMRWNFYYYSVPQAFVVLLAAVLSLLIGLYLLLDGRYLLKLAFGRKSDRKE
ncbi:MAG: hypothetical protein JSV98_05830 [candidate division WOR-3 bacterium]|nr:MAG: hypothetical protein JSV98_05830 [candidate division WOR-3 bacterium]